MNVDFLIVTSNNYFKETITLHCDVRPNFERRYLQAHDTHAPLNSVQITLMTLDCRYEIINKLEVQTVHFIYKCKKVSKKI